MKCSLMIKLGLTGTGHDFLISVNAISTPVSLSSFVTRDASLLRENLFKTQTFLYVPI